MHKTIKKVYFIRHAQTDGNSGDIQMGEEAMLTDTGIKQAKALSLRLKQENFDTCYSSPTPRSVDTAKIILSNHPHLKLQTDPCLVERRRPSQLIGLRKDDPLHHKVSTEIYENFDVDGHRYSNEENFDDLNNRSRRVLDLINNSDGENILVITHGYFMRIVAAKILFEKNLTGTICKQFIRTMHLQNTGICEFIQGEDGKWFVWRWNDFSHLNSNID
jgi:broad specificity phosphatase PhoE